MPSFDQTPDRPRPFGYKVSWFAVKTSDPAAVVDALEFGEATPANWASGIEVAYATDPWLFVSPPVGGWVLAAGAWLPHPVAIEAHRDIGEKFDVLFSRLMKRFDDVQFFGSHRVVDFVAWARALKGKPSRIFAWADGEILANIGEQTADEAKLGFANLTGLTPSKATDRIFAIAEENDVEANRLAKSGLSPGEAQARLRQDGRVAFLDEGDVAELAGLWSIDPTRLSEHDHPLGLGLVARLPKRLAQ